MISHRAVLVSLFTTLFACGGPATLDAGLDGSIDAPSVDTSTADLAPPDAPEHDTSMPDIGATDSGVVDAGAATDSGAVDMGTTTDAGFDSGLLTDPALSSLVPSVGALSPAFAGGTTIYTLGLPPGVTSVSLTPTVAFPARATTWHPRAPRSRPTRVDGRTSEATTGCGIQGSCARTRRAASGRRRRARQRVSWRSGRPAARAPERASEGSPAQAAPNTLMRGRP